MNKQLISFADCISQNYYQLLPETAPLTTKLLVVHLSLTFISQKNKKYKKINSLLGIQS